MLQFCPSIGSGIWHAKYLLSVKLWIPWNLPPMEEASISKFGRQSLASVRCKGQYADIFRRGVDHLAEDGRRHEFSLDSLDKEILQTMSRGCKNAHVSLPSDSASESSGRSAQEKAVYSRESPHPEPSGYGSPEYKRHQNSVMSNGTNSSESASNTLKKPSEQCHGGNGQFQADPLPMWPEPDIRATVYKQQVSQDVNGSKHQQDAGHWHHLGGNLQRPGGNNEMHMSQIKDWPFRDVHHVNSKLDAGLSSDTSGEDMGEEARRKQASEGPYSGSMGMFAYPGTPQCLFPGGQRSNDAGSPYVGGRSHQRSLLKSKVAKAPPSKWDDADKWIASPGHNDTQSARSNQGSVPGSLSQPGKRLVFAGQGLGGINGLGSPDLAASNAASSSCSPKCNGSTSVVKVKDQIQQIESVIQNSQAKSSPISVLAKRREASAASRAAAKCADARSSPRSDPVDKRGASSKTSTVYVEQATDSRLDGFMTSSPIFVMEPKVAQKPVSIFPAEEPPPAEIPTDAPIKDIYSNGAHSRSISDFAKSISVRESGHETAQPSSFYRDMGTQMTPNPSVRLPRGATPGTINISPTRHSTIDFSNRRTASLGAPANVDMVNLQNFHRENFGPAPRSSQPRPHPLLDRSLNWSTREEEEEESAACLRSRDCGERGQTNAMVAWAVAWEEAERAKYMARFHQEEARIQAWEELQKSKAQARMRKTEVKLEKLHESASQKMSSKIAAANRKAEEMRAAAEVCRDEHAAKARHRAERIRQTGNVPTTLGCFASRLVPFQ